MEASESNRRGVYWLGGPPCSGKSSVSEILAGRFDLDVYHADEAFKTHARGLDPVRQPTLAKWCSGRWDELWMQPVDKLVQDAIACCREHFALIRADVLATPKRKPLLVEGTALLPGQVAGLLPKKNHALWLITSADFRREHYPERQWVREIVGQCRHPEAAFGNWLERDAGFVEWLEAEVSALNLQSFKVVEGRTVEETAEAVAAHFQFV
jgi:2-phosphoglycerate kinase